MPDKFEHRIRSIEKEQLAFSRQQLKRCPSSCGNHFNLKARFQMKSQKAASPKQLKIRAVNFQFQRALELKDKFSENEEYASLVIDIKINCIRMSFFFNETIKRTWSINFQNAKSKVSKWVMNGGSERKGELWTCRICYNWSVSGLWTQIVREVTNLGNRI